MKTILALIFVTSFALAQTDKSLPPLFEHKTGTTTTELVYGSILKATTFQGALVGNVTGTVTGHATLDATAASPTFTGTITASSVTRGQRTFSTAGAIDTLVISGLTSSDYVLVSRVYAAAADTTGVKALLVRLGVSDTAFVYQTSTGTLRAIKYNWWRVK